MSLLPSSPDVSPDGDPRVVGLDSEEADDLMAALSSTTARRLLAELHDDPAPPGELADRVDTSLQNAQYHLENLEDAGAIEVVGTAYSQQGREMQVYGPADSPLVIYAGEQERVSGLKAALSRLFGGFAALALGSLAVQELFGRSVLRGGDDAAPAAGTETPTPTPTPSGGGGDGTYDARASPEATETAVEESDDAATTAGTAEPDPSPTEVAEEAADAEPLVTETAAATPTPGGDGVDVFGAFDAAFGSGLPPGLAFFLGGATVLAVVVALTYLRAQP
jgi:DNA-binding transcriptional ArsR family regulator